jgi:hypothetical protein
MSERLKHMKEMLLCAAEAQLSHLDEVDAEELGEVVDMIKDLEEAEYYCAVVKAMEESEKYEHEDMMYYGGREGNHSKWKEKDMTTWRDDRRYYDGRGGHNTSSNPGHMSGESGNGNSYYTEREFPHAFEDPREGKSYRSRRMYIESKEMHQDKSSQMKELEKYMQELASDIVEMVEDASTEERQYLSKKISALAAKLVQPQ